MTWRWCRRAVLVAMVAVALVTAVAAVQVPGMVATARSQRERVRANEARVYAAEPVCDSRGQPIGSCQRIQRYFVVRLYSAGIPTEQHLVLSEDLVLGAANPCPKSVCNPDLVVARPSALYAELRPGMVVTASVWKDHPLELRGEDGSVMEVYNSSASDGTDATGPAVLVGVVVSVIVIAAAISWRTTPRVS